MQNLEQRLAAVESFLAHFSKQHAAFVSHICYGGEYQLQPFEVVQQQSQPAQQPQVLAQPVEQQQFIQPQQQPMQQVQQPMQPAQPMPQPQPQPVGQAAPAVMGQPQAAPFAGPVENLTVPDINTVQMLFMNQFNKGFEQQLRQILNNFGCDKVEQLQPAQAVIAYQQAKALG